jgi:hypothetical protein
MTFGSGTGECQELGSTVDSLQAQLIESRGHVGLLRDVIRENCVCGESS